MNAANHPPLEVSALAGRFPVREPSHPTASGIARHAVDGNNRRSHLVAIAILISAAMLVAFATNLAMHLLNLRMQALRISEFDIGLSIAAQALGIVLVAPFAKHAIAAFGIRGTFVVGAAATSGALIAFNFFAHFTALITLRFVFAIGLALLFTISELLVITSTSTENRGKVVGWYATALAVGTAAGPAFIPLTGIHGLAPLLWGAFLFWLAIVPIFAHTDSARAQAPVVRKSAFGALRVVPIAFVSAFVFGAADVGGMSLLSVYGTLNGYDYSQAALLAAVAMTGGIVLQIPLGYISNQHEPRIVLLFCGVGAIFLLTLLPHAMGFRVAALGVSFMLGGLLAGFYTIGLICIAKYCRGVGISAANGCFVSICGLGELVGPLATGASIHYLGSPGFVVGLTLMLALYLLTIVCLKQNAQLRPASA